MILSRLNPISSFSTTSRRRLIWLYEQTRFAETEAGIEGSVFISVNVEDDRDVKGWVMDVYDQNGNNVRTYAGNGNPSGDITWSTADNGIDLKSGEKYTISPQGLRPCRKHRYVARAYSA